MKKNLLIIVLLILLAPGVWAQTIKRTTRNPGFFVPQGALQTGQRTEKLVPVEQMKYRGQPAQVVIDMQQQARQQAEQEANKVANQRALEKMRQERKEQVAVHEHDSNLSTSLSTINNTQSTNNNTLVNTTNAASEKLAGQEKDEEMFAQIIEEYRRDVKAISQRKPTRNQRLIDMIADYKDIDRSI